ncbi:MAG: hypothetical protein AAF907_08400 [Planctomycetota bacterium]
MANRLFNPGRDAAAEADKNAEKRSERVDQAKRDAAAGSSWV